MWRGWGGEGEGGSAEGSAGARGQLRFVERRYGLRRRWKTGCATWMNSPGESEAVGRPYGSAVWDVLLCVWCWSVLTRPRPRPRAVPGTVYYPTPAYANAEGGSELPPLPPMSMARGA